MVKRDETSDTELTTDSGFTLIELLVALAVFSIFIAVAITAVVQVSQTTLTTQSRATSAQADLNAFQNLDREVRYADSVNFPGVSATGSRYVEFRLPAASTVSGLAECYQWRYDPVNKVIQRRHWIDQTGVVLPSFTTMVSNVTDLGGTTYPFAMLPASAGGLPLQQLQIRISSGTNSGLTDITTSFVAKNTSQSSPSNADLNGDGVSDTPVCLATGNRP